MIRSASFGRCERWFDSRKQPCNRPARYVVYETRRLCRECLQAFRGGRDVRFHPGQTMTAAERWAFWERLRADVQEVQP